MEQKEAQCKHELLVCRDEDAVFCKKCGKKWSNQPATIIYQSYPVYQPYYVPYVQPYYVSTPQPSYPYITWSSNTYCSGKLNVSNQSENQSSCQTGSCQC